MKNDESKDKLLQVYQFSTSAEKCNYSHLLSQPIKFTSFSIPFRVLSLPVLANSTSVSPMQTPLKSLDKGVWFLVDTL